jgi:hypothetical protein
MCLLIFDRRKNMGRNKQRVAMQFQELLAEYEGGRLTREALIERTATLAVPEKPVTEHQRMVAALCKVMGQDVNIMFSRYGRLASQLIDGGYSAELVEREYGVTGGFYKNDWRGIRGNPPSEYSIKETIAQAARGWAILPEGRKLENGKYQSGGYKTVIGNEVGSDARAEAERLSA